MDQVYAKVNSFLMGLVPQNVPVVLGYSNLVPAPLPNPGFIVFEELGHNRLRYSVDLPDYNGVSPIAAQVEEDFDVGFQIDCVGPQGGVWAARIETLWKNQYGCAVLGPVCAPLTAESAPLAVFIDSEQNYEKRWLVDAHLQWNPITTISQLYANALKLTLRNVVESYIAGSLAA